jgi:Zc3h12a-like Ribonuclease NYN domain/S1 RNA binding domain
MTQDSPERRRIVVDGSNIATEGRSLPSLAQLDEAIRAFLEEYRGFLSSDVTVVVDATFGHRIDPSEVAAFDQAIEHGEMVTPPAGAIGRGDGFILRIAEKSGALVLSNDSFQEFHAERPWLFEPGRLIGGKPIPGVGWIFTPRTPVRGVKSRAVTAQSKRASKVSETAGDMSTEEGLKPSDEVALSSNGSPRASGRSKVTKAPKAAKVTKTAKTAKATKVAKAAKVVKVAKAAKVAKGTEVAKANKAGKTTKATKATKATKKVAKVAKNAPEAKGTKVRKSADVGAKEDQRSEESAPPALNDPMTFLTFVADHPVESTFDGTVVSFTSHGAHVDVGGMLCHIPLRGMADPPPIRARQVLTKGETRPFVLVSLDAARRRAELALPGVA